MSVDSTVFAHLMPNTPVREHDFRLKSENHITVLSAKQRALLAAQVGLVAADACLMEAANRWNWRFRIKSRVWQISRCRDGVMQRSLVVRVDQPAQGVLRRMLWKRHGVALGFALPHITLYTHQCDRGIGVANRAVWRQQQPQAVARLPQLAVSLSRCQPRC